MPISVQLQRRSTRNYKIKAVNFARLSYIYCIVSSMDMQTPGQPINTTIQQFSKLKSPFQVDIRMEQGPNSPQLIIQLLHLQQFDKYKLKVNQEKLTSDPNLSKYYEDPGQLFNELKQSFQQINISQEGVISFEVSIGKAKKRLVKLELEKEERSKETNSDFKTLWKQTQKIKKETSEEIKILKDTNQFQAQQIQKLKNQLQEMGALLREVISQQKKQGELRKISIEKLESQLLQKLQANNSLDEGMAVLSNLSKKVEEQSQVIKKQVQQIKGKLQEQVTASDHLHVELQQIKGRLGEQVATSQQTVAQLQQIKMKHQKLRHSFEILKSHEFQIDDLNAHDQHQHNGCFDVNQQSGDFVIQKISSDKKWHSFIVSEEIKDYKSASLKVQAETVTSQIMIGVCTSEALDQANLWKTTYAIAFDFRTSCVWMLGKAIETEPNVAITNDLEVIMTINTKNWSLKISKDHNEAQWEELITEVAVPQQFREIELYFFVALREQGDKVKIIPVN